MELHWSASVRGDRCAEAAEVRSDAETGNVRSYGDELNLQVVHHFDCGIEAAVKYADYNADNFATDTQKLWFWLYYSF